jgi:hypothetical protein
MQRTLRRVSRVCVVILIFLLSFNPAAAWHCWGGGYGGCGWGGGYCGSYYGYCRTSCYSSCYDGYCSYGYPRVVYSSEPYRGGCGGCGPCESCGGCSSCGGCGPGGEVIEAVPHAYQAPVPQEAAPTPPSEMHTMPSQPTPPATVNKPMETTTPPPTLPSDTTPSRETDSLFGGTPEATPPVESAPPGETAPSTANPPTDNNDLFGTPPAETPSEKPAEQPPAADDFFGTESTTPVTPPPPTETPTDSGTTDESGMDSMFGTPAEPTTPETTEEKPAAESAPSEDSLEDIFGPSTDATPVDASTLRAERVLREPGGLASGEMRTWVDNTGSYSCHGRLVRFLDGYVRLMKDNGHTTTVPLYRLSATDLAFVNRQASVQPRAKLAQAESAGRAEAVAAN